VEAGRRSVRHLSALSTAHARVRLPPARGRGGVPGRVRLVTGSRTAADSFDAVATVRRGTRVGAIAIRLVRRDETWLVDAAGCPEDAMDNVHPSLSSLATRPGLR
jgi:hypothetical protein